MVSQTPSINERTELLAANLGYLIAFLDHARKTQASPAPRPLAGGSQAPSHLRPRI